jgi:hypothetical protein
MTETPKPAPQYTPGDVRNHGAIVETPPPDWLTAQAKAIATARAKKPRSAYARRWR